MNFRASLLNSTVITTNTFSQNLGLFQGTESKFIVPHLNTQPHVHTTHSHEILFTTHTYLTFAFSLINADGRNAAVDPHWGRVIHQTLPSPLSPHPYRKGLGTKLIRLLLCDISELIWILAYDMTGRYLEVAGGVDLVVKPLECESFQVPAVSQAKLTSAKKGRVW